MIDIVRFYQYGNKMSICRGKLYVQQRVFKIKHYFVQIHAQFLYNHAEITKSLTVLLVSTPLVRISFFYHPVFLFVFF